MSIARQNDRHRRPTSPLTTDGTRPISLDSKPEFSFHDRFLIAAFKEFGRTVYFGDIQDDAMAPLLPKGQRVLIAPTNELRDGLIVAFRIMDDPSAVLVRRFRWQDRAKRVAHFEPNNPKWQPLTLSVDKDVNIIGVLTMARRLSAQKSSTRQPRNTSRVTKARNK